MNRTSMTADREIQRVEVMLTEKAAIAPGGKGDAPMKDHLRPLQVGLRPQCCTASPLSVRCICEPYLTIVLA
jgi:hypothetical protein